MPLHVRPALPPDIPRIFSIIFSAFTTDALHTTQFPRRYQDEYLEWYYARLKRNLEDENLRCLVAVDSGVQQLKDGDEGEDENGDGEDEEVIAFVRWEFPTSETELEQDSAPAPKGEGESGEEQKQEEREIPFPPHANKRLIYDYLDKTYTKRRNYVDSNRDFVLQMLATHPAHQGRGAAKLLIGYGLQAAEAAERRRQQRNEGKSNKGKEGEKEGDEEKEGKVKVFLEATPAAVRVYERLGWRAVDEIVMELGEYVDSDDNREGEKGRGGEKHRTVCMVRG